MRTQVAIIGAGPAGLLLSHLLHLEGVESVVIETRSRRYIEERIRAGVLEHGTVDLLNQAGAGDRLRREGLVHHAINLRFAGGLHRIEMHALTGRSITVYGQHEIVKDLIDIRLRASAQILFEVDNVAIQAFETKSPNVRFTKDGEPQEIACDFIAGCDGFHGICRSSIPAGELKLFEKEYPFGWLGILAQAHPVSDELIYSNHERGFALLSMRSPAISRLYLQCSPDEDLAQWPDDRIWNELHTRLGRIEEGPILQKGVTAMRSFVCEPMQYGRLFLAGDSAHIVPPTGAKGMNLAIADVRALSRAVSHYYRTSSEDLLHAYSQTCLPRVWRAQHFSWWMTSMLHRPAGGSEFEHRRQLAELENVTRSTAAATNLAENYTGLPFDS